MKKTVQTTHVTNAIDYSRETDVLCQMLCRVFDYLDSLRGRTPTADNIGVRLQHAHGNSTGKFAVLNKHAAAKFIFKNDREDIGVVTFNESLCGWEPERINTYVKGESLVVYMVTRGVNPVSDGGAFNENFWKFARPLGIIKDPKNANNWIDATPTLDLFAGIDYSVFDKYVSITTTKKPKATNMEAAHARWIAEIAECVEHDGCKNLRDRLQRAESQVITPSNGKVAMPA